MSEQRIQTERSGDVVIATLSTGEGTAVFGPEGLGALNALLEQLAGDEELAALVLTGAHGAFAAAATPEELRACSSADALTAGASRLCSRVEQFPAPVIGAIRGDALGLGCELALACDLRVVGESTKLGLPDVEHGVIPAAGGTYRLARLVGLGRARDMVYTGRVVDAAEALRIGLVNIVALDPEVAERARALGEQIAANGRAAVRASKRTFNALSLPGQDQAVTFESAEQAMLFDGRDFAVRGE